MKKRNPLAVFLFSVITLGIYDIYWLVSTKKVLNAKTSHKIPTIWLLIVPSVILIAGYVSIFVGASHTQTGSAFGNGQQESTQLAHPALSIGLIILGFILTFFVSAYWFFKFSKAVNEYTQGKMGTAVTFLILWIIHLIGVALIQDTFNDMAEDNVGGGNTPVPAQNSPAATATQIEQPTQPSAPPQTQGSAQNVDNNHQNLVQ